MSGSANSDLPIPRRPVRNFGVARPSLLLEPDTADALTSGVWDGMYIYIVEEKKQIISVGGT